MIICKSDRELQLMRESGLLVAQTHQLMKEAIRPGVTTFELDQIAEDFIRASGATPSFKGYLGFPRSICTSINEELVHGIPGKRQLQEGDIISIDIGVFYRGYHGDSAWTYPVGVISEDAAKLLQITEQSLYDGIKQVRQDERLHTVSHAIQQTVEAAGYAIVREYEGHGIGAKLHEEPQIPNYGQAGRGPRLKNGMVLAIEPMVNIGQREVHTLDDKWTVVTTDGSLCAHFEHTVAVVSGGYEILTITEV